MAMTTSVSPRLSPARALLALTGATALTWAGLADPTHASAAEAVAPVNSTITVTGAGWGHGIGLSQYGAYGAANAGLTYSKILAFYYAKTTLGSLNSGNTIRIWITADNDNRLNLKPASGLKVVDSAGKSYVLPRGSMYTQWRISRSGTNRVLQYRNASGSWLTKSPGLNSARVWYAENPATGYVMVPIPGGTTKDLRGRVSLRFSGTGARTVNTLPMESYLRSVVPSEMPTSWSLEAVKSQAVAARSYAARLRSTASASAIYDTCDTSACQVYRGLATRSGTSRTVNEDARGDEAVQSTANKVVKYGSELALTMYSSSNGGHSADGGKPYLVAKPDPYDGKPRSQLWSVSLSSSKIQAAYPTIGTLKSVDVTGRDGDGPWGGRATSVTIKGSKASISVTGGSFKKTFGLKERLFLITAGLKPGTGNYERWQTLGGVTGWVGAPTGSEKSVASGLHAPFAEADLLWSSGTGSHWLSGAVLKAYVTEGGAASDLGFPTTDVTKTSAGTQADFKAGRISCPTGKACVVSYG